MLWLSLWLKGKKRKSISLLQLLRFQLVVPNSKAKELVDYRDTYQKTHRNVHCLPGIARLVDSPGAVGRIAGVGPGIGIPVQLIAYRG
jgi:hypothetical protein